jgi:hypothetical protein
MVVCRGYKPVEKEDGRIRRDQTLPISPRRHGCGNDLRTTRS